MRTVRCGLGEFGFKLIACAFMTIGHMRMFDQGLPDQYAWIGRMALPMFLYQVGCGCRYARSKRNYVLRLYAAGVLMSIINVVFKFPENIFPVLLNVAVILCILRVEDKRKKVRYIAGYVAWQAGIFALASVLQTLITAISSNWTIAGNVGHIVAALGGFAASGDYGLFVIAFGVAMGLCGSKLHLSVTFLIFSLVDVLMQSIYGILLFLVPQLTMHHISNESVANLRYLLFSNDMVMLVGTDGLLNEGLLWAAFPALLFILMYGGRRNRWAGVGAEAGPALVGRVARWFFYAYYPLHFAMLALLWSRWPAVAAAAVAGVIF